MQVSGSSIKELLTKKEKDFLSLSEKYEQV